MPEATVKKNRYRSKRQANILGHDIIRHRQFSDIELAIANHPPVADIRGHVGQNRQIDSVRLNGSFLERADALIVAASQREVHFLTHAAYLARFIAIANELRID